MNFLLDTTIPRTTHELIERFTRTKETETRVAWVPFRARPCSFFIKARLTLKSLNDGVFELPAKPSQTRKNK
jgi:hypothetical protein